MEMQSMKGALHHPVMTTIIRGASSQPLAVRNTGTVVAGCIATALPRVAQFEHHRRALAMCLGLTRDALLMTTQSRLLWQVALHRRVMATQ